MVSFCKRTNCMCMFVLWASGHRVKYVTINDLLVWHLKDLLNPNPHKVIVWYDYKNLNCKSPHISHSLSHTNIMLWQIKSCTTTTRAEKSILYEIPIAWWFSDTKSKAVSATKRVRDLNRLGVSVHFDVECKSVFFCEVRRLNKV